MVGLPYWLIYLLQHVLSSYFCGIICIRISRTKSRKNFRDFLFIYLFLAHCAIKVEITGNFWTFLSFPFFFSFSLFFPSFAFPLAAYCIMQSHFSSETVARGIICIRKLQLPSTSWNFSLKSWFWSSWKEKFSFRMVFGNAIAV